MAESFSNITHRDVLGYARHSSEAIQRDMADARFLALSIADKVQWAIGDERFDGTADTLTEQGSIEIPDGNGTEGYDLQARLRSAFQTLAKKRDRFADIKSVGVSTIGITNSQIGTLNRVALMKAWNPKRDTQRPTLCIVDFVELFSTILPSLITLDSSIPQPLIVLNDVATKGFVELEARQAELNSLFYVMIGDGVNGGMVTKGGYSPRLAPEIGHLYPLLHPADAEKLTSDQSACRMHGVCYEGLMSARRIKASWGKTIPQLASRTEARDIISFYAAQLCMVGALMFDPDLIVLGGADHSGMIGDIKNWMAKLNGGYIPRYDNADGIRLEASTLRAVNANIEAAAYVARLARDTNLPICVRPL